MTPRLCAGICLLLVWCTREVLPLLSDGYRPPPSLLRLTCELVRRGGNDPPASATSRRRSAAELTTRGAPSRIRTPVMSVCKTDAFDHLANGAIVWCARGDLNAH